MIVNTPGGEFIYLVGDCRFMMGWDGYINWTENMDERVFFLKAFIPCRVKSSPMVVIPQSGSMDHSFAELYGWKKNPDVMNKIDDK